MKASHWSFINIWFCVLQFALIGYDTKAIPLLIMAVVAWIGLFLNDLETEQGKGEK